MKGNTIDIPILAQRLRNWKVSVSVPMLPAISLMLLRYVPSEKNSGTNSNNNVSAPNGFGTHCRKG